VETRTHTKKRGVIRKAKLAENLKKIMDNNLKELIEMSCLSGKIDNESRNLIYKKADELNVSKEECDVYISGFLNKINLANNQSQSKTHIFGYILYFTAFWDVFWSLHLLEHSKTRPFGYCIVFFGALMFYFSFRLMKKNSLTKKILFFILIVLAAITSILYIKFLFR
jgi:hypothetical protein